MEREYSVDINDKWDLKMAKFLLVEGENLCLGIK